MRNAVHQSCCQRRVVALISPRSLKQSNRRVVPQAVIQGQSRHHSPGILRVKPKALHILRKTSVVSRHVRDIRARWIGRLILRSRWIASQVHRGLRGVCHIESWILRRRVDPFGRSGQGSAQHRLVDEAYAEPRSVAARAVRNVVAQLILLLVAQHRKRGNRRDEQVVSVSLVAGNRAGCDRKRKRIGESQLLIARLRQVQAAGIEHQRTKPLRRKIELLPQHQAEIIVV